MKLNSVDWIAVVLTVVGGVNWGLVGAFEMNVVDAVTGGEGNTIARVVYVVVGLAALYLIYTVSKACSRPKRSGASVGGEQAM
ncbi:MAG: DUF378 domain-containing protein [Candidatus Paceibacterota bacterium]